MLFPAPLLAGRLIKRYKRFLADMRLESGDLVTAHCANSGSMLGLMAEGAEVWLSRATNPDRKLAFTWELIRAPDSESWVGINTALPNAIAAEAIAAGLVPALAGYERLRREVKYGRNSRIDILLESDSRPPCYVEIKSVTLRRGPAAQFPDAVTARGAKHLEELATMVAQGARSVMLYLVQREDCTHFEVAEDIDRVYAQGLSDAVAAGVETLCFACRVSPEGIALDKPLPLVLPFARRFSGGMS